MAWSTPNYCHFMVGKPIYVGCQPMKKLLLMLRVNISTEGKYIGHWGPNEWSLHSLQLMLAYNDAKQSGRQIFKWFGLSTLPTWTATNPTPKWFDSSRKLLHISSFRFITNHENFLASSGFIIENSVAILEVLVLHDVRSVSRTTADGSYRGFMIRGEPGASLSLLLEIEVDIRSVGMWSEPSMQNHRNQLCWSSAHVRDHWEHKCWGKSSGRMPNHSSSERVRHFYVIFSVLVYFLWKISARDAAKWI